MKIEQVDGRTVYTFRQSGVGEFLLCNERARANWIEHVPDGPSDATAIGTAVHSGAEHILRGGERAEATNEALDTLYDEWSHPLFRAVQTKNYATAERHVKACLEAWCETVYPQLGEPIWIEHSFNEYFCDGPNGSEIRLSGTVDFADAHSVWDWKTAGDDRKYGNEAWKLSRWAVQPTTYTWAAHHQGLHNGPTVKFTWAAMTKGARSNVQLVECERSGSDWDWLAHLLCGIVKLEQAKLEQWPVNDQHALCSAKWCANWANCKGRFV
jgi:hypothetical protein